MSFKGFEFMREKKTKIKLFHHVKYLKAKCYQHCDKFPGALQYTNVDASDAHFVSSGADPGRGHFMAKILLLFFFLNNFGIFGGHAPIIDFFLSGPPLLERFDPPLLTRHGPFGFGAVFF